MAKTKYTLRSETTGFPIEDVRFLDKNDDNFSAVSDAQAYWQLLRNGKPLVGRVELASTPEFALEHVEEIAETFHEKDEDAQFCDLASLVAYGHMVMWSESPEFIEKHDALLRSANQLVHKIVYGAPTHTDFVSVKELAGENSKTMFSSTKAEMVQELDKDLTDRNDKKYNPYYSTAKGKVMKPMRGAVIW